MIKNRKLNKRDTGTSSFYSLLIKYDYILEGNDYYLRKQEDLLIKNPLDGRISRALDELETQGDIDDFDDIFEGS